MPIVWKVVCGYILRLSKLWFEGMWFFWPKIWRWNDPAIPPLALVAINTLLWKSLDIVGLKVRATRTMKIMMTLVKAIIFVFLLLWFGIENIYPMMEILTMYYMNQLWTLKEIMPLLMLIESIQDTKPLNSKFWKHWRILMPLLILMHQKWLQSIKWKLIVLCGKVKYYCC